MNYDQIVEAFLDGRLSKTEAENMLSKWWSSAGVSATQVNTQLQAWVQVYGNTPMDSAGFALTPADTPPAGMPRPAAGMPELLNPAAGYRRGLTAAGRDIGLGSGELGEYLRSRLEPTFAVFGAQNALKATPDLRTNAFEKYAQLTQGGGLGQGALTAFRDLSDIARTGLDKTAQDWGRKQPWVSPENEAQRADVGELAREAAMGRYGGMTTRYFMPSNKSLINEWETGPTGDKPSELLAYLRRAFGL